ncbi:MAG: cold shock domain-containing protein [Patescibacteria group bacterium]
MTGTIKKKIEDRAFGFIACEGESKELFFHKDDLNGVTFEELREGDAVTFDVVQGEKGPAAKNVQRAS